MTDTEGTEAADVRYITGRLFKRIPPTPSGEWEQETKVVWDRIQADLQQARERIKLLEFAESHEYANAKRAEAEVKRRDVAIAEQAKQLAALMDAFNDQAAENERLRAWGQEAFESWQTELRQRQEAEATIERLRGLLEDALFAHGLDLDPDWEAMSAALTGKEQE